MDQSESRKPNLHKRERQVTTEENKKEQPQNKVQLYLLLKPSYMRGHVSDRRSTRLSIGFKFMQVYSKATFCALFKLIGMF